MTSKVAVLGAGFAGLSAACHLAAKGHEVTLVDRHDHAGGRARTWTQDGYRFDMGPSWYWMPDVFENFFRCFGHEVPDLYTLKRLDPSYRVVWPEGDAWDVPAGIPALRAFFETHQAGGGDALDAFLRTTGEIYEAAMGDYLFRPSVSLWEYADPRLAGAVVRLRMLESMQRMADRAFSNPRLARLVAWPVLFLGAPAERTSAMYSLMSYADMALGTWYPQGGMHRVIEAMVKVAASLGVRFCLGETVTAIDLTAGRATGLRTATGHHRADAVVAAADYHHVEQHLLPPQARQFSASWWDRRTMSPSSLLFYLGLETELDLPHHTLFFDRDLDRHMSEVYDRPQWPEEPLFYVCVPSATDRTVAPPGCSNVFILVPLAAGLHDDEQARERVYTKVMGRLETHLGRRLTEHVVVKRSYAMQDFIADHSAYKGNAYGMANTLRQTGPLKPPLRSKKVPGLYFAGQLTVPGPGMPPSLVSGELAARVLHNDLMAARGQ